MLNFCTLFDSNYLSRGLALYNSLIEHCPNANLFVIAFDEKCFEVLQQLSLSNMVVIKQSDFEDPELLNIKSTRSAVEYCWTCTPSIIKYCFETYDLDHCTYLDADIFFFEDPRLLLNEFQQKNGDVLITEHRYTKGFDKTARSGKYCVQFMTFKNNENGSMILDWWRRACLDWCYSRVEDGKFGDQKYLDDWPERFKGVIVLEHLGGGVAPWNIQQYDITEHNDSFRLKRKISGEEFPLVFYHFHQLRFYTNHRPFFGWYWLGRQVKFHLYRPYLFALEDARQTVIPIDNSFDPHGAIAYRYNWKDPLRRVFYSFRALLAGFYV